MVIPKKVSRTGAVLAATVLVGAPFAPLIAEELEAPPAAVAATEGTEAPAASTQAGAEVDGTGTVFSSQPDARFRIERAQASAGTGFTDIVLVNVSDVASTHTWVPLDSLRGNLPEGATFGSVVGSGGEVVKGSDLVAANVTSADSVDAEAEYWYVPNLAAGGEVRISVVQAPEATPAPTPEPKTEETPAPDATPEPTPAPDTETPKPSDEATTPAPEKSEDATPAPVEEKKSAESSTVVVDNAANVSKKADEVYKAPAQAQIPQDNAVRHDSAGRVVSTAPVAAVTSDAQEGTTTTRFEDGGEVTTNAAGEVVESTLGSSVTTTGAPVTSTVRSTASSKATPGSSVSAVKGQTLRTGAAGVASNVPLAVSPAVIPMVAAGGSLALAGTVVAGVALKNRKREKRERG